MSYEIIKERLVRNLRKKAIENWGEDKAFEEMYLQDPQGCINEKYLGDDLNASIRDKFYYFFEAIREALPDDEYIEIHVEPSYEGSTTTIIILKDKLLFRDYRKAWGFYFETEYDLMNEMFEMYTSIEAKLEKSWDCYTMTETTIRDVAERKGLSLDGLNFEGIIHYIKKGVESATDDVREQIIIEAVQMEAGNTK